VPWEETEIGSFRVRHESDDRGGAMRIVATLDGVKPRLDEVFPRAPEEVSVIVHASSGALSTAHPALPLARALTAPAGRRYLAGWLGRDEIHVLSPAALEKRASQVEGSREVLRLSPAALYTQLVVAANNDALPPPFSPLRLRRFLRWAWLVQGAGQHFSGQVAHVRPIIARRLREGRPPSFPPSLRDAPVLGGSVFDLLARERGDLAAAQLAGRLHPHGADAALRRAWDDQPLATIERTWRTHLEELAAV
jgi:hypothetical protein